MEVARQSTTAERVRQQVMFVEKANKKRLLAQLLRKTEVDSAIVFTRTKHGANRVVKDLGKVGIEALAIHGNKAKVLAYVHWTPLKRENSYPGGDGYCSARY